MSRISCRRVGVRYGRRTDSSARNWLPSVTSPVRVDGPGIPTLLAVPPRRVDDAQADPIAGSTVEPVVEEDDPFLVVGHRFVGVIDDERARQSTFSLHIDVRVVPVSVPLYPQVASAVPATTVSKVPAVKFWAIVEAGESGPVVHEASTAVAVAATVALRKVRREKWLAMISPLARSRG